MKEIPLTKGYTALVDDEDYERVSAFKWRALIQLRSNGTVRNVYAQRSLKRDFKWTTEYLHRFVLGISDPGIEVDHEDHHGLNCQKINLRSCRSVQNCGNARKRNTPTSSRYKGVYRESRDWCAKITKEGRNFPLGTFVLEEDAARAYDAAAREHFGEFAFVNFPVQ